jgi:hypothetical protein
MKDWDLTSNDLITEAIDIFGSNVVSEVRAVVELSDVDGAYSTFRDLNKWEHAECVEFLYLIDNI